MEEAEKTEIMKLIQARKAIEHISFAKLDLLNGDGSGESLPPFLKTTEMTGALVNKALEVLGFPIGFRCDAEITKPEFVSEEMAEILAAMIKEVGAKAKVSFINSENGHSPKISISGINIKELDEVERGLNKAIGWPEKTEPGQLKKSKKPTEVIVGDAKDNIVRILSEIYPSITPLLPESVNFYTGREERNGKENLQVAVEVHNSRTQETLDAVAGELSDILIKHCGFERAEKGIAKPELVTSDIPRPNLIVVNLWGDLEKLSELNPSGIRADILEARRHLHSRTEGWRL